jgi:hypothetical protein
LVVIAIIAILASMLFPAFSRARESAKRIVCISNLKQISMGVMMYTQDYDEGYPVGYPFWFQPAPPNSDLLVNVLYPYVKSTQVWSCPSWKGHYSGTSAYLGNYSFITNTVLLNNVFGVPGLLDPRSLSGVNDPTSYPMLFCGIAPQQTDPDTSLMNAHTALNDAEWDAGSIIGGDSILYADGHARFQVLTRSSWDKLYTTVP